jgi:hypothetical protein
MKYRQYGSAVIGRRQRREKMRRASSTLKRSVVGKEDGLV